MAGRGNEATARLRACARLEPIHTVEVRRARPQLRGRYYYPKSMPIEYYIEPLSISEPSSTRITAFEFERIKDARRSLTAALSLEETYEILLSNYRDLEMESLAAATTAMTSTKEIMKIFLSSLYP